MRLKCVLDRPLPERARAVGIQVLLGVFARAFDVEPPRVVGWPAADALSAFREFSAACMEEALASPEYAARKRAELEARARKLGELVRRVLGPRDDELAQLVSFLYAAISIDVVLLDFRNSQDGLRLQAVGSSLRLGRSNCSSGDENLDGDDRLGFSDDDLPVEENRFNGGHRSGESACLRFRRCYFSERYTPELCAFMSAFDSGFVGGLYGGGSLRFESRITAGAPCCLAVLV